MRCCRLGLGFVQGQTMRLLFNLPLCLLQTTHHFNAVLGGQVRLRGRLEKR